MTQIDTVAEVISDHAVAQTAPLRAATAPAQDEQTKRQFSRLMWFFALVYMTEGLGQAQVGLIAQPVNYYLKQVFGWTPVQITAYLTVLTLPWVIKPLYGMFSDFVPLFGYRRKAYLILSNAAAAIAYLLVALVTQPGAMVTLLILTAYGMAISSTLCGAVLVENGQKFGASGAFVNQQWLWFNIAAVVASATGGLLVQYFPPASALHWAAAIVGVTPLMVVFGSLFLISEERKPIRLEALKQAFRGFTATFRSKPVLIVALFLFFYFFSPGFATPLYFYMTDKLKFSQGFIGALNSISSIGWILGRGNLQPVPETDDDAASAEISRSCSVSWPRWRSCSSPDRSLRSPPTLFQALRQ